MLTLAELKQEAKEHYSEIDINWDSNKPLDDRAIIALYANVVLMEHMYTSLVNGESVLGLGESSLSYEDREKYIQSIADALMESYWLIEVAERYTAIQELTGRTV